MTPAAVLRRPVPRLRRPVPRFTGLGNARFYAFAVGSSALLGVLIAASKGPALRLVLALVIAFLLITLSLVRPAAGVVATFIYLVLMAFLRRVLIPAADWISTDPLLLVGPVVALVVLARLFMLERRPVAPDLLSKLVLILLLITLVEVANPFGEGIKANVVGLLYMAVPLFWFFIGREIVNDGLINRLFVVMIILAIVSAGYGIYQTQVGYPSWDQSWVNTVGGEFTSLNVGGKLRAVGLFSSFVEYALFLGSALAASFAFVLRGRSVAILALPVLALGLFLSSNRSGLIMSSLAIVVMLAIRTRRPVAAALITLCAIGGAYGGLKLLGSSLSGTAASSSSALVSHQLAGISDPLNQQDSTLLVHLTEVKTGITSSIHHPLGIGPGATNNAAGVNQQSSLETMQTTEVDLSNAFVAFGPLGGALYLAIVLLVLGKAVVSYFRGREALLPVIGLLIVGAGQWLTGGHYALSPFTWLLIGAAAAGSMRGLARVGQSSAERDPLWHRARRSATT